jgi:hypothetical protein
MTATAIVFNTEPITKLNKDLLLATATLTPTEVRYLVDAYYIMQDNRIRAANQVRALNANEEPHQVIDWLFKQNESLENQIKRALKSYAESQVVGRWALSIVGIGPVITAGMLAHIDITKAPSVGHIWRFAGLDPTTTWGKGEKRPFNAALKVLCWKAGESFVKTCNHKDTFYGKFYIERKQRETEKNERGEFAEQAKVALEKKRIGKDTEAYKAYSSGKLPPAHIHARACRYAVKLFLAHLHEKMYEYHYGTPAPLPYPIAHMNHVDKIEAP